MRSFHNMGTLIKDSRKDMTQDQLAKLVGFAKSFLSQVEKGRVPLAIKHHLKIALLLGIEPIDIQTAWINDHIENYEKHI